MYIYEGVRLVECKGAKKSERGGRQRKVVFRLPFSAADFHLLSLSGLPFPFWGGLDTWYDKIFMLFPLFCSLGSFVTKPSLAAPHFYFSCRPFFLGKVWARKFDQTASLSRRLSHVDYLARVRDKYLSGKKFWKMRAEISRMMLHKRSCVKCIQQRISIKYQQSIFKGL